MTDDLYLQYLQTPPASRSKPKPTEQAAIPDDILPFVQPRPQPAPKPVDDGPPPSIQAPKPKPTAKPQEPIVPLVVFTAFDADTAQELAKRLQNTGRPENDLPRPSPAQPPPIYPSDIADYEARQEERLGIHSPAHDRGQTLADLSTPEPEPAAHDLEFAWSSEQPYLNLDIAETSYYFEAQQDDLVRGVAISLQHEKMILHFLDEPTEYLKRFATYTWDEESDAAAEEFIQWYVERFRPELERQWDDILAGDTQSDVEYWIRNVANDERESVIVYDLEAGETLFVRYGDRDSVAMQEWHQKLTEGRNIIVIHNHPNNSGASLADLSAVAWLDAEYLLVVNPDGTLHRHQRIGDTIVELEPIHNPDYVAPADPLETAMASIAYVIQNLLEIGNPPEMVMRQGETLWWQRENVIVPYNTTETKEQVAARMGIPLRHLQQLNKENTETSIMYIPAPGWYTEEIIEPTGSWVAATHSTGATFFELKRLFEADKLISQWNALSLVEQQMEMALIGSHANIDRLVRFDNTGYDFDYTVEWIQRHETAINQAASDFQIPVALLNTVLASELLYDYGNMDQLQDDIIRANFNLLARQSLWRNEEIRDSWDGAGVANAHYPALIDAYRYIAEHLQPDETHPWKLDPDAPDLESAPRLDPSDDEKSEYVERWANYYNNRNFDQLDEREQEVARFWIRLEKLNDVPRELRIEIAHYLADDSGSVRAAAMISQMYSRQLSQIGGDGIALDNPRDIARIWGRYRSADQYFDYLGNARLAYPIAEYWSNQ